MVDEYRLPKGIAARKEYAETIGTDGMQLLIGATGAPQHVLASLFRIAFGVYLLGLLIISFSDLI